MRILHRTSSTLTLLLFLSSPAALLLAQTRQSQDAAKTVNTVRSVSAATASAPAVTLAVTVRDKQGNMIPNLTAANFTLLQDGRAQTIQSVKRASTEPLTFGLVAQVSGGARSWLGDERTAARNFASHMLASPGGRAFVVQFGHEVDLLSDLSPRTKAFDGGLKQVGLPQTQNTRADSDTGNSHNSSGRSSTLYDAIYLASSEVLDKPAKRKVLIVVTDGVDRGSKESLFSAIEAAQRNNVTVYAIYFKDNQPHSSHFNMPGRRRNSGLSYPGHFPGGYPGGNTPTPSSRPTQGSRTNGAKILNQICSETGGYMFVVGRKLSVSQAFASIALELNARYLIGYTPGGQENFPGYHSVKLTTNKQGLIVRTRQGYYSNGA